MFGRRRSPVDAVRRTVGVSVLERRVGLEVLDIALETAETTAISFFVQINIVGLVVLVDEVVHEVELLCEPSQRPGHAWAESVVDVENDLGREGKIEWRLVLFS
jgi:hypothetical protein